MNYKNTFILVADDCPVECGVVPVVKAGKSKPIHVIQYELISEHPYYYTQEDILFMVYAIRNSISTDDDEARRVLFKKEHPCLRSSALGKNYGRGFHFDPEGKVALYARDSSAYAAFSGKQDASVKIIKAMRNKRIG